MKLMFGVPEDKQRGDGIVLVGGSEGIPFVRISGTTIDDHIRP